MEYAVVSFVEKEGSFSEIPTNWLTEENTMCWWPKSKAAASFMTRKAMPDYSSWTKHRVVVQGFYPNLERARRVAEFDSSSADEEIRNQKRKIRKPKMIYPTVTTDEESSRSSVLTPPPQPITHLSVHELDLSDVPIITQEQFDSGDADINQFENIQTETNEIPYTLESEKIYEMLISINLHVKSVDERLKKMEFRQNGQHINLEMANTFTDTLPITNLEAVEKFEELLSNKPNNQAFITFMHGIGGRNIKENINRMLKTCFTNEMATRCSWLGQRGNFRMCDLRIIAVLKNVIKNIYKDVTDKEFECSQPSLD
ncbi:hypothetical protein RN001_015217 [Aquatica leii]|uniref:DUF4806 domain-containing protein n=1 Tax=Aquatica leii TaxID=1421715 RepID=A0AAN7P1I0_9COLE|nr:hypothetical protein RN001_015217 [Aquatica leii]